MSYFRRTTQRCAIALAATVLLISCGSDDASQSHDDGSAIVDGQPVSIRHERAVVDGESSMVVYGIIVNHTRNSIRIESASSPAASSIVLQRPSAADSGSFEVAADGFELKSLGGVVMEPGGFRLQLAVGDPAAVGDSVDVTVTLDTGGVFTFTADVESADG